MRSQEFKNQTNDERSKIAINKHKDKLNWFKNKKQQSLGVVERLNNKVKVLFRNA